MTKKEQVMALWCACFDDTKEFVDFLFANKYRDEDALVQEEGGRAVAALQMLPYPLGWATTEVVMAYISGACTAEESRGRGVMTALLAEAFGVMHERGVAVATLIPAEEWLYDYYERQGFAAVFQAEEEIYEAGAEVERTKVMAPEYYDERFADGLYDYFSRQMEARTYCVRHPQEDYRVIIQELYLSGGRLLVAYAEDGKTPVGMAFATIHKGVAVVNELLYDTEEVKKALLGKVARMWSTTEVRYHRPTQSGNTHRTGMARIMNTAQMLGIYAAAHPAQRLVLRVDDRQLAANGGVFVLADGLCRRETGDVEVIDIQTDIQGLTRALFGIAGGTPLQVAEGVPYMSLMLD